MKWFKKAMLFAGIGICAISSVPAVAHAKQVATFKGIPVYDNKFGEIEIQPGQEDLSINKTGASFAAKYDPRTIGMVSAIENQGETNTCWAFASIAAIEANLMKKGYVNNSVNLSEKHLAYYFYHKTDDPLKNTAGDKNIPATNWALNGGTLYGTAITLSGWTGVVNQSGSEDYSSGRFNPEGIPDRACYDHDYVVENTYFYNYNVNTIKQAVMDHGAVAVGFSMDFNCYLSDDGMSYYSPVSSENACNHAGGHAVAIVGWDDNYSRYNFKRRPSKNGAWIVKNSYGNDLGTDGYLYISYEDASISECVAFEAETAAASSDYNYQHDGTGAPLYLNLPNGSSIANTFKVKGTSGGYNEVLEAVALNTFSPDTRYSLQIYTGVTSAKNPTKGKAMLSTPQTGTLAYAGYNRIELKTPITLAAGEKYSVVLTLSSGSNSVTNPGIEMWAATSWIEFAAAANAGNSFLQIRGENWLDCGNYYDMAMQGANSVVNVRIKAFTSSTNQKTSYKLSSNSMSVSKGSTEKLSLKINPSSIKRKVTWTSSNKKVATVSSSGKVKGIGYGTATIKAKFVAGSKTKTLSCKVTVGPSKVKGFKAKGAKKKVNVSWKKNNAASGYEISYSKSKDSGYKKLVTVNSGSKTKANKKLKKGTYYVKIRPYVTKDKKKLYGSYTSPKKVNVK